MNNRCDRSMEVRDYAFGELDSKSAGALEQHLDSCEECASELDRLRLTTSALRALPDRDVPQRIAFVSDKVFAPSRFSQWWNSAARLGFASACVLAIGLVVAANGWRRGGESEVRVAPASKSNVARVEISKSEISKLIDDSVKDAVAKARAEDARTMQAALAVADRKHDQEHRALMVAMGENLTLLQKRLNTTYSLLASSERQTGAGQ